MLDFLNINSSAVQGISTAVLVIVTIYYAWQTRQTVLELKSQGSLEVRPVLLPKKLVIRDKEAWGGDYSCISSKLENIGNGPALQIHIGLYDPETKKRIASSENLIDYLTKNGETDDSHIHLENKKLNQLSYKEDQYHKGEMKSRVKVILHYNDLHGKTYFSERTFYFKKGGREFLPTIGSFKLKDYAHNKLLRKMKELLP